MGSQVLSGALQGAGRFSCIISDGSHVRVPLEVRFEFKTK